MVLEGFFARIFLGSFFTVAVQVSGCCRLGFIYKRVLGLVACGFLSFLVNSSLKNVSLKEIFISFTNPKITRIPNKET